MTKLTPEAVLLSGQIFKYDDVRLMTERHGFDIREGNGTSHVFAIHQEYPDLKLTLNRCPHSIRYQKEAAEACIEVSKRETAKEQIVKPETQQHIPEDIMVTTSGNALIIRHKEFPVIGLAVNYDPDRNGIADIATRRASTIREKATLLKDAMKIASKDFGISFHNDGQNLVMSGPVNFGGGTNEIVLVPFSLLTDIDPVEVIDEAVRSVREEINASYDFWLLVENNGLTSNFDLRLQGNDSRVSFDCSNIITRHTITLGAPVTPQGIVSNEDQFGLIYKLLSHLFETGVFKTLQEQYGIITTGKNSDVLRLSHPIFEMDTKVVNPRHLLKSFITDFNKCAGDEQDIDALVIDNFDSMEKISRAWNDIIAFVELVEEKIPINRKQARSLNQAISSLGIDVHVDGVKKIGAPHRMTLSSKADPRIIFSCMASNITRNKEPQTLLPPKKIPDLIEFLKSVRDANIRAPSNSPSPKIETGFKLRPFETKPISMTPLSLDTALQPFFTRG